MSTALITGMHGTLAPVLMEYCRGQGVDVVSWDRQRVSPEDDRRCLHFLDHCQPNMIFHLANGSPQWCETLGKWSAQANVPLLYTSSVSVFSGRAGQLIRPDTEPDSKEEYGRYKHACEMTLGDYPSVRIARLGWQIAPWQQGNTMTAHFGHMQRRDGFIRTSRYWIPACSMISDTAATLVDLIQQPAGTYHVDANPGFSTYALAYLLDQHYHFGWKVIADDAIHYENRMQDDRVSIRSLAERLACPSPLTT